MSEETELGAGRKMEFFVPRSHVKEIIVRPLVPLLLDGGFSILFLLAVTNINLVEEWQSMTERKSITMTVMFAVLAVLALVAAIAPLLEARAGVVISEEEMFRVFLTKRTPIDIQEIVAVKLARAEVRAPSIGGSHLHYINLSSKDGTPLYSMFLLRQCDDATLRYSSGDQHFYLFRRKYIIEKCIYNQAIIDFLTARNPNLLIIPPEGIQPEPEPRKPGPVQGWITRVTPKAKGFH